MPIQRQRERLGEVTVRFVQHPPSEEILYFAQRCAKERWLQGPLTVVVESRPGGDLDTHEVRLEGPGSVVVSEHDPDVILAVRNAFDRYELVAQDAVIGALH